MPPPGRSRKKSNNISPYSEQGDSDNREKRLKDTGFCRAAVSEYGLTQKKHRPPMETGALCGAPPRKPGTERLHTVLPSDLWQEHHKSLCMFCAEWSLVKRLQPGIIVIPLRCRCWSCEYCRPWRAAQLVQEAKAGKPNLFITLTSRYQTNRSPAAAARDLVRAWRQVRAEYLKKHGPGSLPFLAVFEATKRGWPHLHIVARARWVDQGWLSKRMAALIGSPVVDVRRVKGLGQLAAYVAKYIGKDPHRFAGTKRYWRSRDYLKPLKEDDNSDGDTGVPWRVVQQHWRTYAEETEALGFVALYGRSNVTLYCRGPP